MFLADFNVNTKVVDSVTFLCTFWYFNHALRCWGTYNSECDQTFFNNKLV